MPDMPVDSGVDVQPREPVDNMPFEGGAVMVPGEGGRIVVDEVRFIPWPVDNTPLDSGAV
jgi:hypothetical protein